MKKKIFITGGAGYIGTHTCVEILKQNHEVMVFDNLVNSSEEALHRVELLTNKKLDFFFGDIRDKDALMKAMELFKPTNIIHFAGLKSVGESVSDPLKYFDVNVTGSINILKCISKISCNEIVFSSSATVYGSATEPPYVESDIIAPISPYGRTKYFFETLLEDWVRSNEKHRATILRYFNPVGAHASGLIGEDPNGRPNNLMPLISQVAQRKVNYLPVFGTDYDTLDGSCERDYIHISDLALGHLLAVELNHKLDKLQVLNLGTGKRTSVIELVKVFEEVNNVKIPRKFVERRIGDVPISYADPSLAYDLLGFKCKKTLVDMCEDTWNWQIKNPEGYDR